MSASPHRLDVLDRPPEGLRANFFETIVPAATALIAIDLQGAFLAEGMPACVPAARATIAPTRRIATALREAGGLVVHTRHTVTDSGPQAPPRMATRQSRALGGVRDDEGRHAGPWHRARHAHRG